MNIKKRIDAVTTKCPSCRGGVCSVLRVCVSDVWTSSAAGIKAARVSWLQEMFCWP